MAMSTERYDSISLRNNRILRITEINLLNNLNLGLNRTKHMDRVNFER